MGYEGLAALMAAVQGLSTTVSTLDSVRWPSRFFSVRRRIHSLHILTRSMEAYSRQCGRVVSKEANKFPFKSKIEPFSFILPDEIDWGLFHKKTSEGLRHFERIAHGVHALASDMWDAQEENEKQLPLATYASMGYHTNVWLEYLSHMYVAKETRKIHYDAAIEAKGFFRSYMR